MTEEKDSTAAPKRKRKQRPAPEESRGQEKGSQVYYRKWRPQLLAQVVGQEHVTHTLLNALKAGRVAHAYLFCGPRGTGKTSTGRILAKAVNCLQGGAGEPCNSCAMCREITDGRAMDIMEIDAASNRGIDDIRELRERVRFSPANAKCKVYIIDEVHMLTEPAANALLKTLEEPPPHVLFVLATTEPHKVPATILSRCQRFDFRRIPQGATLNRLADLATSEGIEIDEPALKLISKSATGSLRDAENLLEQLVAQYGTDISFNQAQAMLGISGDVRAHELARHMVENDIAAGLKTINSVAQDGVDLKQFNRELVDYLRGLLLIKAGAGEDIDIPPEALSEMKALAHKAPMSQLSKAVRMFREVEAEFDGFSTLPLELALVDSALTQGKEAAAEEEVPSSPPPRAASERPKPIKHPKAERPPTPMAEKPPPPPPLETPPPSKSELEEASSPMPSKAELEEAAAPTPSKAELEEASSPTPSKSELEEAAAPPPAKSEEETPPTPPPPTPAEKPTPLKEEKGDKLEVFRSRWKEVVNATKGMGSRGALDALLRSACEPVGLEDDTLILGFYHSFHKEKIEDPKYRHMVEAKVSEIFGGPYKIRCVLNERKARSQGRLVDAALEMGAKIINEEDDE